MPKDLVCVGVYSTTELAYAARFALETEGITSYLDNEWVSSLIWTLTDTVGGVKLLVDSSDANVAAELLKNPVDPAEFREELNQAAGNFAQQYSTDANSPYEESITINLREDSAKRAFRAAIIGLFFPPFQFFTIYLLMFNVLGAEGNLSPKYQAQAWGAAVLSVSCILLSAFLFRSMIYSLV
jgi:hypothetical protein